MKQLDVLITADQIEEKVKSLAKQISEDYKGKEPVIICEDIVDSGNTLDYFTKLLKEKNPASVKIAAFLSKPSRRQVPIDIDYLGFEIEDKFVIGYGLDYAERFRELPYVAQINSPADLED